MAVLRGYDWSFLISIEVSIIQRKEGEDMNQSSIYRNFKMLAIAAGMMIVPQLAAAQCMPGTPVGEPQSCQGLGYPLCYTCSPDAPDAPESGCVPSVDFCDDGNSCTTDVCTPGFVPSSDDGEVAYTVGCVSTSDALEGDDSLDSECYVSGSDENGICEPGLGENCNNTPDCQDLSVSLAGISCTYPNSPNPPYVDGIPRQSFCTVGTDNFETIACSDGDACTTDICDPLEPTPGVKFQNEGTCSNVPKACSAEADGCCPAGCIAPPPPGLFCATEVGEDPVCDPDCFPAPSCGDGLVTGTEQCDGSNDDACGGAGCNSSCQCNDVAARCLTGSGDILGSDLNADCTTCSLNPNAVANGFSSYSLAALLGLSLVAGIALRRKAQ